MLVYKHFLDMSTISHKRLNKVLSSLKKKEIMKLFSFAFRLHVQLAPSTCSCRLLYPIFVQINEVENGVSCLQVAGHRGHEKMVKLLLERGANINKADKDGNTPLHFAVQGCVKYLFNITLKKCPFCCSGQYIIWVPFLQKEDCHNQTSTGT